jgi:hypothetical protein
MGELLGVCYFCHNCNSDYGTHWYSWYYDRLGRLDRREKIRLKNITSTTKRDKACVSGAFAKKYGLRRPSVIVLFTRKHRYPTVP